MVSPLSVQHFFGVFRHKQHLLAAIVLLYYCCNLLYILIYSEVILHCWVKDECHKCSDS